MNPDLQIIIAPMGEFKDHFSTVAANYAEFRPVYPRALFEWIARVVPRRDLAWDCGTGNGQAAIRLADFFKQVIATDASAEQVANAPRHESITYLVAPAERSPLSTGLADAVTVAQAAHWFDLPRFYAEARRVLRPGGMLFLWCYGSFHFGRGDIDDALKHFYYDVVGPFWPPERRYIEEDYRTLEFPLDEFPAPDFHMEAEFTRERLAGYLRTWSATQRFIKQNGFDPVLDLERKLDGCWTSGTHFRVQSWPIRVRAGRFRS